MSCACRVCAQVFSIQTGMMAILRDLVVTGPTAAIIRVSSYVRLVPGLSRCPMVAVDSKFLRVGLHGEFDLIVLVRWRALH